MPTEVIGVLQYFTDVPWLCLCATWPPRPAGSKNNIASLNMKTASKQFYVQNYNVIAVTSWPAQKKLRITITEEHLLINSYI